MKCLKRQLDKLNKIKAEISVCRKKYDITSIFLHDQIRHCLQNSIQVKVEPKEHTCTFYLSLEN